MNGTSMRYYASTEQGNRADIKRLQEHFGERPGGYSVDKYYFRTSIGNKPLYWEVETNTWKLLKNGMEFDFNEDGLVVRIDDL